MYIRRRSNWYIYFIAFGITLAIVVMAIFMFSWYLFPTDTEDAGADRLTGGIQGEFVPTDEYNFRLMTMISDGYDDDPTFFCIVEYNAPENKVVFVPVPAGISMATEGRSLTNIHAAQGSIEILNVVNRIMGVGCSYFVKMDRSSFEELLSAVGNVEYSVPRNVKVNDGGELTTYNSGYQSLSYTDVYRLISVAEYDEGESFRLKVAGDIFSELINQNYNNIDGNLLDIYFGIISRSSETNITEDEYKKLRPALLNTVEDGIQPAEFYIPYGEYTADGGFDIADNSIITIKQKAGLL